MRHNMQGGHTNWLWSHDALSRNRGQVAVRSASHRDLVRERGKKSAYRCLLISILFRLKTKKKTKTWAKQQRTTAPVGLKKPLWFRGLQRDFHQEKNCRARRAIAHALWKKSSRTPVQSVQFFHWTWLRYDADMKPKRKKHRAVWTNNKEKEKSY